MCTIHMYLHSWTPGNGGIFLYQNKELMQFLGEYNSTFLIDLCYNYTWASCFTIVKLSDLIFYFFKVGRTSSDVCTCTWRKLLPASLFIADGRLTTFLNEIFGQKLGNFALFSDNWFAIETKKRRLAWWRVFFIFLFKHVVSHLIFLDVFLFNICNKKWASVMLEMSSSVSARDYERDERTRSHVTLSVQHTFHAWLQIGSDRPK